MASKKVHRWYVGPIDAIETRTLDGRVHVVERGQPIECTEDDAAFFDLQPSNWSAEAPSADGESARPARPRRNKPEAEKKDGEDR